MDTIWIVLLWIAACVFAIPLLVVLWITLHGLLMYAVAVCKRPMKRYIEEIREREDYVTIDKIAPFFLEAIVVSEDFRFFEHKGYSVTAMRKAFALNVKQRKIITNTAQGCKDGNYSEIDQPQNAHSCENYTFQ